MMKNLRKLAKGKECTIRIPLMCNKNNETTVLCHVRMVCISGMGHKVPDALAAYACSTCHDIVDGRIKSEYSYGERRLLLLEGVMRTQAYLIEQGILKW